MAGVNRFLGRRMTIIRHTNRNGRSPGESRAYVHEAIVLKAGGPWDKGIVSVIQAKYDPALDLTIVAGEEIPYETFCAQV